MAKGVKRREFVAQNHKITKIGGDLWRSSGLIPYLKYSQHGTGC